LPALFKDIIAEIDAAETLGENIDVLMPPKVNEVTSNYIQELIAGKKTGMQALSEKQKALLEDIAAGNFNID
jgi:raffinose/stachyose/melibiose transport system substrate-binding protein